jgi:hypothetical protein
MLKSFFWSQGYDKKMLHEEHVKTHRCSIRGWRQCSIQTNLLHQENKGVGPHSHEIF